VVKLFFTAGRGCAREGQETAVQQLEWIGSQEGGAWKEMPKGCALCELVKRLDEKKDVLLRHSPRVAFMKRCLRDQMAYAPAGVLATNALPKAGASATAMGENLAWLVTEYHSGRKVIVWAASMHNMRDAPKPSSWAGSSATRTRSQWQRGPRCHGA
jgi:erythromycin esterase-like protein